MAYVTTMAPCYQCKRASSFNPHLVPSVVVNAKTGRPIDDLDEVKPPVEERIRQPLCAPCFSGLNARRKASGLSEIPVLPGAYDAERIE
jgi:hypothetical protein